MAGIDRRDFLRTGAAVAAGAVLARQAGAQNSLELARDGASAYQIVRPAQASPSQLHAAEELRRFTKQMTGAELAIISDEAPLPAKAILLGETRHSAAALGAPLELGKLGDDGFRLVTRRGQLLILGSPVRGTLYGVYELLSKYGGCRWYASFHSVIPQRKTWTLPELDETQTPAFAMREPFWWDMFDGDQAARNKANGSSMRLEARHGGKIRFGGGLFVHTAYPLMPPEEFFGPHPEYYSELKGQRVAEHAQLCWTHPDVIRILTERVLARIRKDPTGKLFSVSQNDWGNNCTCARCRAIDEREGTPAGSLLFAVNQIAEAVEREFPNVWIETLAYQYTRRPPKTLSPRRNVVPRLCSIECDFSKPLPLSQHEQNKRFVQEIRGWSGMTDKLYVWDYTTNFGHYVGPHPNFGCLQGNVQFFRDNHVVGLFEQGAYQGAHGEFGELRGWLLAQLLWNPDQSVDKLYDDFFSGYYGAAAEPVRTYFDELQALVKDEKTHLFIWQSMKSPFYSDAFFERATKLWAEAERRVKDDPKALYRVRMSGLPVLYAKLERWPAMKVKRVLRDGVLRAEGVDPAYAELATEALRRLEEGRMRIAESEERHRAVLSLYRSRTAGMPMERVSSGALSAGAIGEANGALLSLTLNGAEYVSSAAGGVDTIEGRFRLNRPDEASYRTLENKPGRLVLRRQGHGRERTDRVVTVTADTARLSTEWSVAGARQTALTWRCALDVGPTAVVHLRVGTGDWRTLVVPADQTRATWSIPGNELKGALTIAGAGGRGLRLTLPEVTAERLLVEVGTDPALVRLYLVVPAALVPGQPLRLPLEMSPLAKVADLPSRPGEAVDAHRADRIVVPSAFISISRPGTWGDLVPDAAATDGYAMMMTNTHYEWCVQYLIDARMFVPEAKYQARARIRVERAADTGLAFWAGVYDTVRRRGWGEVNVPVTAVKDGYQWYDLTAWVPETDHWVWAGPGRFDLKTQKSAVKGVWIDRFEFVRVK